MKNLQVEITLPDETVHELRNIDLCLPIPLLEQQKILAEFLRVFDIGCHEHYVKMRSYPSDETEEFDMQRALGTLDRLARWSQDDKNIIWDFSIPVPDTVNPSDLERAIQNMFAMKMKLPPNKYKITIT